MGWIKEKRFWEFVGEKQYAASSALLWQKDINNYIWLRKKKGENSMETYDPGKMERHYDVMKKWKKARKTAGIIVAVLIVVLLGLDCFYNIQEQEQAVLTTFGVAKNVGEPGLHFKIPFIQKVQKVNTTIQGFSIGYNVENNESQEKDSLMITKDYNFVNVDFFIEYKVADPVKAVYASKEPAVVLENISKSCIRSVIGSYDVDEVLTTGKNEIQSKIRDMIVEQLEKHDIGLQVTQVTIQDSEPPTQAVMEAFKAVETAKQGKETAINNANKYRNEKLPEATAEIDRILQEAEAQKTRRINEANGEVAKFNAMYEEYVKNPQVTKQRMFYETMEDVLPRLKVIIDGTDKTNTLLPLDSFMAGEAMENQDSAESRGEAKGQEDSVSQE